jgi:hypothetical protein
MAALTLWIVAASVAIALLGSSTLLFPPPDVNGGAVAPPGKDVVARVVAQIFTPAPARRQAPPPPATEAAAAVTPTAASALAPTTGVSAAEGGPFATRGGRLSKPRTGPAPKAARKDKDAKAERGKAVAGAKSKGHDKAVAGAKSKGHGPLEFEPPRGPKQSHVRPAKGKGKSAGRPPAHARARR